MIHLVSGKGGVGKSTVAAALAWKLAAEGRRTLLIELGERSYFRHIFQREISGVPAVINSHLSVTRWEGEEILREYLRHFIKVDRVVSLFFDNKIMKALVQGAPALKELALLGKVTSGVRKIGPALPYDELVVDAYATGHFRALWRAPIGMAAAIPFGPMGEQSRQIVSTLRDPARTQFYVVLIPEDLPVTEGLELARDIQSEMEQQPKLVLNRWLESPLSVSQLQEFSGHDFADYLTVILNRQDQIQNQLSTRGLEVRHLPWLFSESGAEKVRILASELGAK